MIYRHKGVKRIFLLVIFIVVNLFFSEVKNPLAKGDNSLLQNSPVQITISVFDQFLQERFDNLGLVGAAATVVYSGNTIFTKTMGIKKAGTSDSIDSHTSFRLASVSKGFAGVLTAMLHHEDIISLDDKVVNILPDFQLKDSVNTHNLTIKHVLNHTSGLVPHAYDNLVEAKVPVIDIINRLNEVNISGPPGLIYGYQNVVFSLIDTIAAIKSGKDYSDLLKNNIFIPLKMVDASTGYNQFINTNNKALPHLRSRGSYKPVKLNKSYYNLAPAAGVNASISDLALWLKALLGHNEDVINKEISNLIETPLIKTPLKLHYTRRWGTVDEKHYSLGWRIYIYKGRKIIYHGGYVKGYRAEIAFCPEEKIGIAYLQNCTGKLASESIPKFFNLWFSHKSSVNSVLLD